MRLFLVAERQEWSWLVRSSPGLPSYAVAGAAAGAGSAREPPVSHGGFWKNFLFNVACLENWTLRLRPRFCQLVMVFRCCLWSKAYWIFREILRANHLLRQWIHGLREALDEFHLFSTVLRTRFLRRLLSVLAEWRSVHSRCFLLQLLPARPARWNPDIISRAVYMAVCGNFRCVVQHFSGPSMIKKSSSSRAHANSLPWDVVIDTVV